MRHLRNLNLAWLAVFLLEGCAGQKALVRHATDPISASKVVLLEHNALGEVAVAVKQDPTVSQQAKDAFVAAYRKTVCGREELKASVTTSACKDGPAAAVERFGRAFEASANAQTEQDLLNATDALTAALTDLIKLAGGK